MNEQEKAAAYLAEIHAGAQDSDAAVARAKEELDALLVERGIKERVDEWVARIGLQPVDISAARAEFERWISTMPRVHFAFQRFAELQRVASWHAYLVGRIEEMNA